MAGEGVIRKVLSAIPWRKLTYAEARELALRGEHLVEREGQLVGAPRGVGHAQLPELRGRLDEAAREGAAGHDWYAQARGANTEMSGGNPETARELAAGQAVYSNQATPSEALGWTLGQRNRSLLEGPEEAAKKNYHYGFQAKQYGDVLRGEDPETALGLKTGPYFRHMDPTDPGAETVGVNDSWMGRLYGYGREKGGFSESEHSFMHGENVQAAERMRQAGLLPEGEGVGEFQAAAWVGQRARMLRAKYPAMPEAEVMQRATASVPDAMDKFTAYETTEQVPPRANEHMAGAVDLPMAQREELTRELRASAPGESDPYYRALGMAQRPSAEGLGQFSETVEPLRFTPGFRRVKSGKLYETPGFHDVGRLPVRDYLPREWDEGFIDQHGKFYTRHEATLAGQGGGRSEWAAPVGEPETRTDYNPNQTMRPMVSYQGGRDFERAPQLDQPSAEMLRGVNTLRTAVDAQAAGAYHTVKFSGVPALQNAARIAFPEALPKEMTALLYEQAQEHGLSLIDTGAGSFTLTGDFGQMPAAKFRKAAAPLLAQLEENGARVRLGKYVGAYNEMPTYGEGRVTRKVLEDVTPRVGQKLDTAELRAHYLAKNKAETGLAERLDLGAPRADVQKLRRLLAKGGVEGLRKYVKGKDIAKLGLPGLAAGVYGEENR